MISELFLPYVPLVWLTGVVVLLLGAPICLLSGRYWATHIGVFCSLFSALPISLAACYGIVNGTDISIYFPLGIGLIQWRIGVDALSGVFMLLSGVMGAVCAVYGAGYWKNDMRRRVSGGWAAWLVMLAGIQLVAGARDGLVLILAWELMSISSLLLVNYEYESAETRAAGWAYLVAAQFGAACLIIMVALMGLGTAGDLNFQTMGFGLNERVRGIVFVLALLGFGSKAGLFPMHVWLPAAHPAAPSHVSAMMSGVLIKMGIYGIIRMVMILHYPAPWWGWTLFIVGGVTALGGVTLALMQDDLKRLLAYSSVENVGVIVMSLGLGVLGWSVEVPILMVLGFSACLLHLVNHAAAKGAMFMAAGSVMHGTGGERNMNRLGGLIQRMPATGMLFILGAATMAALPPFSIFSGEFTLFVGGVATLSMPESLWMTRGVGLLLIVTLALVGGLSCACFVKAAGMSMLGAPRSEAALHAHESNKLMLWPIRILASFGILGGLLAGPLLMMSWHVFESTILPSAPQPAIDVLFSIETTLVLMGVLGALLLAICVLLYGAHAWVLRGRDVRSGPTWDCGYIKPDARMQYTAFSFSEPIMSVFAPLLGIRRVSSGVKEPLFPVRRSLRVEVSDVVRRFLIVPLLLAIRTFSERLRPLQSGHVQLYILYLAGTLLFLLVTMLK